MGDDAAADEKRKWLKREAVRCFGAQSQMMAHHTRSMDYFVLRDLSRLITSKTVTADDAEKKTRCIYRWIHVRFRRPYQTSTKTQNVGVAMLPNDCRTTGKAYSFDVIVDIEEQQFALDATRQALTPKTIIEQGHMLFRVPILLGSCMDHVAQGWPGAFMYERPFCEGGFYVLGSTTTNERNIPLIETRAFNVSFLDPLKRDAAAKRAAAGNEEDDANIVVAAAVSKDDENNNDEEDVDDDDADEKVDLAKERHFCGGHKIENRGCHESRRDRSSMTTYLEIPRFYRNKLHRHFMCNVKIQYVKGQIPATIVLLALGTLLKDIPTAIQPYMNLFGSHPDCEAALKIMIANHPVKLKTPTDALLHIAVIIKKPGRSDAAQSKLNTELYPFIGLDTASSSKKSEYLAYDLWRLLLRCVGMEKYDDRDFAGHQRYENDASLIGSLVRQSLGILRKRARTLIMQQLVHQQDKDWNKIAPEELISKKIAMCMGNGTWRLEKRRAPNQAPPRTNVTMAPGGQNPQHWFSTGRRMTTGIKPMDKKIEPRQFHRSKLMRICCTETPEGEKCATINFLAVSAHISIGSFAGPIETLAKKHLPFAAEKEGTAMVMINGAPIGWTNEPYKWVDTIRSWRRSGWIDRDTSVAFTNKTLKIDTDPRRCMRPLIIVSEFLKLKTPFQTWSEWLDAGVVEYLDATEEQTLSVAHSTIADLTGYTHMELDSAWMMGTTAITIVASDHNQSPRNLYQSNMGKSALPFGMHNPMRSGAPGVAQSELYSGQTPAVQTKFANDFELPGLDCGMNLFVCIFPDDSGQEDAIVLNKATLQRGAMLGFSRRNYHSSQKSSEAVAVVESFGQVPLDDTVGLRDQCYTKITTSGLPRVRSKIAAGDPVIGKYSKVERVSKAAPAKIHPSVADDFQNPKRRDQSVTVKHGDGGTVERTSSFSNQGDSTSMTVSMQTHRDVVVGDKFSTRHGQKGVVGAKRAQEDMPILVGRSGAIDAFITPLGCTSRMTIGQVVEMMKALGACYRGRLAYAHPFDASKKDCWTEFLRDCGAISLGLCKLINGKTGRLIEGFIFRAPVFFQRLNHMVCNKEHARARGPINPLTRQPNESRSNGGGQRFGEMERNCLEAQGAAANLHERRQASADNFIQGFCRICGRLAEYNVLEKNGYCRHCDDHESVVPIEYTYSNKLVLQEIQALHIDVRFKIQRSLPTLYRSSAPAFSSSFESSTASSGKSIDQLHTRLLELHGHSKKRKRDDDSSEKKRDMKKKRKRNQDSDSEEEEEDE